MRAYDAAYAPDLAAVRAAGGIAVNHYLTAGYAGTSTHPDAARSNGLGSVLTYEEAPNELVGASRATGQAVGRKILAAVEALPTRPPLDGTVAVYASVDVNVADPAACDEAFRGIRDVLDGKLSVRAYAQGSVIDHLAAAGITQGKGWLAAPTSWPGFNPSSPNVCLVQRVGTDVAGTDLNDVLDASALGAWWPEGSPYAVKPTPPKKETSSMFALTVVVDGHGNAIPVASQPRCVVGPGVHVHNNPTVAAVVARVADAGGVNQAQHDQTVAALAVVGTRPVAGQPVDVGALASALAAELGPDLGNELVAALGKALGGAA